MWTKLLKVCLLCVVTFPLLAPSNPIMIIRCGANATAPLVNSGPCGDGDACDDGYICVNGTCVPVCNFLPAECISSCDDGGGTWTWNATLGTCECEFDSEGSFTCCPTFLTPNISVDYSLDLNIANNISLGSYCTINNHPCYDGDIEYFIDPILCNATSPTEVIKIFIIVPDGACIQLADLQNCDLVSNDNFVLELASELGSDAAFCDEFGGGNGSGNDTIFVEFTRDPSTATTIDFLDVEDIVIPACPPSAFDPCSCSNPNVYNADGTVQYWADTMVFNVTPGASVYLCDNRNGDGFLDPAFAPYTQGSLLGTDSDMDGIIEVPFFNTPGEDIDISWSTSDACDVVESFFGGCSIAVTACIVNPIPTLGQWGLMVLGLCLLITGVLAYRSGYYKTFSNRLNLF